MLVEFSGGSLDGQQRRIERFYEYINVEDEVYYAKIIKYAQLGFIYVWYQFSGNLQAVVQ